MNEKWVASRFNEFQDLILENFINKGFSPDEIATFCLVLGACSRLGLDEGKIENFNLCLKKALELYNASACPSCHVENSSKNEHIT